MQWFLMYSIILILKVQEKNGNKKNKHIFTLADLVSIYSFLEIYF